MSHDHQTFDERAATWDENPGHVERAATVADRIAAALSLGPDTGMLEYGAGTGLVTQALQDRVGPITLADTSQGMRDVIRLKIEAGTLRPARVWDVDLSAADAPDETFDLIVTVMTLHHIPDLAPTLSRFAGLLAPAGHLCIVDLDREDGSFHGDGFGGHSGFRRQTLEQDLMAAGFGNVIFSDCDQVEREGATYPLFLAIATH